jgi:hypothetical protein
MLNIGSLVRRLVTKKPELERSRPVRQTKLIEGSTGGNMVIYDSRTNKTLFGGGNPDLSYMGRLNKKHIARKQEETAEGKWLTYFVDEDGNILFGRKYEKENLSIIDSRCEEDTLLDPFDSTPYSRGERLKGTEDTLVECVGNRHNEGVFNFYDASGKLLASDIPAFLEKERTGPFGRKETVMSPARSICFVEVDGQKLFEIQYDNGSEVYEFEQPHSNST